MASPSAKLPGAGTLARGLRSGAAAQLAVALLALAVRVPRIHRLGPTEGGGDEWYAAWRALGVLLEGGDPGSFAHPGLFYDLGAAIFGFRYALGRLTGGMADAADLLAAFAADDGSFLRQLQYLSAVAGALTAAVVYELGARVYSRRAGLLAALLFALMPLPVACSQNVRVDSVYTLLTTASGLSLRWVWSRGGARAYLAAGLTSGLAASANHPGWFLLLPFAWAHHRRRRGPGDDPRAGARWVLLAAASMIAVYLATNPYLALATDRFIHWFSFQLSFAFHAHPYREGISPGFYVGTLMQQGSVFCMAAALAIVWSLARSPGYPRGAAAFTLLYLVAFTLISTRFERFMLPALPWLCLLVAGACDELTRAHVDGRTGRARLAIAGAAALIMLLGVAGPTVGEAISPRDRARTPDRSAILQWLVTHAEPGATVWLESDTVPFLQAAFADPGGRLPALAREGYRRAFPGADLRILKGELVERSANYDPALLAGRIQYAVACEETARYVREQRGDLPAARAFYDVLEREGARVLSTEGRCHIYRLPPTP